MLTMFEYNRLNDQWYANSNENVAMNLRQTIPLLWQLDNHKHIGSISEMLGC